MLLMQGAGGGEGQVQGLFYRPSGAAAGQSRGVERGDGKEGWGTLRPLFSSLHMRRTSLTLACRCRD